MLHGSDACEKLMSLSAYDYVLPDELIAQEPLPQRDQSRLLIVDRKKGTFTDAQITDLSSFLNPSDQLVFNDTKVIPARLRGKRVTGGSVEILLHTPDKEGTWWALVRPAKKIVLGEVINISPDFSLEVIEAGKDGHRKLKFHAEKEISSLLEKHGEIPLPPYIRRKAQKNDWERYQTIYAYNPGAVAAPTAGLHFSQSLFEEIDTLGAIRINVTLHVGLGTFQPVMVDDIRCHQIHGERCLINEKAAMDLNALSSNSKRFCIGTTSLRIIESMVNSAGLFNQGECFTHLFIYPGYKFKAVDALFTNFHLPKSTLLMLVSAFAGYELIREAYTYAIKQRYRFFSYGDAMLII